MLQTNYLFTGKRKFSLLLQEHVSSFQRVFWKYSCFSSTVFLSHINNVEGGYRKSQRPSICPSVSHSVPPSIRKESPLTATIFHRSLPNFYTMFISLKTFTICSFIKKFQKLFPWQPFFFTFQAYLPMFVPYIKAWGFLLKLLQYLHKGPT